MAFNHFVTTLRSALRWEGQPVRPYVHPSQYRAPENVRLYSDGMHKLYEPSFITLAISVVTLGLYVGVPHILLALLAFSWWRPAAITLGLLLASLLLPAKPLRLPSVLSSYVFLCWRRYFKFSYLFEKSLDCYQDYVIAQFPHGAFPLGALLGGTFMATEYPGYTCYATAASSAFYVPIWRHVHAWLGTEVCTKTNFHHLLGLGVKGHLPHRHHHHAPSEQQQQQDEQQLSSSSHPGKGTPFASAAGAAAAAADEPAASISSAGKQPLPRRRSLEQLLQTHGHAQQHSQLSLAASLRAHFRHHHSLSDTESSDSESDAVAEPRQGLLGRRLSIASDASSTACTCCSTCSGCACGAQQQQQQQSPRLRGHSSAPVRLSGLSSSGGSTRLRHAAPPPAGAADALLPPPEAAHPAGDGWCLDPSTGGRKTGVSVGLMVGGIAEMFMIRRDHERIKLKDRKGFVRVALEHGVPILPVYMFGANQVLDFGPPWLQRLSRRMRASVGMIYGLWGLPVPRRLPIFKVTGRPMDVGPAMRKDHPDFAARVDELHAQFIEEIQRVYYTHRGKYGHGFENRPLVIC